MNGEQKAQELERDELRNHERDRRMAAAAPEGCRLRRSCIKNAFAGAITKSWIAPSLRSG